METIFSREVAEAMWIAEWNDESCKDCYTCNTKLLTYNRSWFCSASSREKRHPQRPFALCDKTCRFSDMCMVNCHLLLSWRLAYIRPKMKELKYLLMKKWQASPLASGTRGFFVQRPIAIRWHLIWLQFIWRQNCVDGWVGRVGMKHTHTHP